MFYQFNDDDKKVCPNAPARKVKEPRELNPAPIPSTPVNFMLDRLNQIQAQVKAAEAAENERKIIENGKPRVTGSHGY